MRRHFFLLAIAALFAGSSVAPASINLSGSPDSAQLDYVGDDWRIGVGLSDEGDVVAELLGVLAYGERSSWLAEGWFQDGAGGLKLNYHWLPGDGDPAQQDNLPGVYKLYLAADQNRHDDRKLSLGVGYEKQDVFFSTQFSVGLTDERLVDDFTDVFEQFVFGTDASGRPFRQLQTTSVLTETFEQAYDYGVGLRLGRFFDAPNIRLQGGLDYEWGDFDSSQTTVSATAEKFFTGTGHSLALSVERFKKSGDFELDDSDTRGMLIWRYAFGQTYRPRVTTNAAAATAPAKATIEARPSSSTTTRIVRSEAEMDSDAFFAFDSAEIRPEASETVQQLADLITRGEILGRVSVVGHTCDRGPEAYNQQLSIRRAESVKLALVAMGVDPEAIVTDGRGESEPAVPNSSEENRRLNRRVDVQFIRVEEREEVVEIEAAPQPKAVAVQEETVRETPAWVMRALRNPAQHKRTVDVYRFERSTTTVALADREFLNRAPLPENDAATAARNSAEVFIDVLANDTDPDGDALTVVSVSQPESGTVVNRGDFVTYAPAAGFQGEDNFTYTISDGTDSASATVTVTVNNDAPVAQADNAETRSGVPVLIDVLVNDSDPNGDTLELIAVSSASSGEPTIVGNQVRYAPNAGFSGSDSFTYTVRDSGGAEANGEVSVTVINDAPVTQADSAETNSGEPVTIDVLANDSDPNGDALELVAVSAASGGTVTIEGDRVRYAPNDGFTGTDSFTYTVRDTAGAEASGDVTVTVINDAPVTQADSAETRSGEPVTIDVLANDSDPNGDALELVAVSAASGGTVTIEGDRVRYAPNDGFTGTDSFSYTVRDTAGAEASGDVTVTVINDAPVTQADSAETRSGEPVMIDVLANDSDPNGDALELVAVSAASGGTVTIEGDRVRYAPNDGFTGTDSFTYTVRDTAGAEASGDVTVTVNSQPPVAVNDTAQVTIGQPIDIDVLANDTDPQGDPITLIGVGEPLRGTAEIVNGRIRYTPDTSGSGSDTFTYEIESNGGRATGTVSVTIEAPAPTASDDSATTEQSQAVQVDVLANDLAGFGQSLTIIDVQDAANGSTRIEGGAIVYTPNSDFVGTDRFDYTIREQNGSTATATVTITVVSTNRPPVAQDDSVRTNVTDTVFINVLANDSDPDGDPLVIVELLDLPNSNVANITITDDNQIRFEPTNWVGNVLKIRYRISDGRGGFAVATLTIKC